MRDCLAFALFLSGLVMYGSPWEAPLLALLFAFAAGGALSLVLICNARLAENIGAFKSARGFLVVGLGVIFLIIIILRQSIADMGKSLKSVDPTLLLLSAGLIIALLVSSNILLTNEKPSFVLFPLIAGEGWTLAFYRVLSVQALTPGAIAGTVFFTLAVVATRIKTL